MGGAWREVNSLIENTGNDVQHFKQNSVAKEGQPVIHTPMLLR